MIIVIVSSDLNGANSVEKNSVHLIFIRQQSDRKNVISIAETGHWGNFMFLLVQANANANV